MASSNGLKMKKEIKNKPASVLAKLKNIAKAQKVEEVLIRRRYCQERFLYRLSVSEFQNNFSLKGGLLLVCLDVPTTRPTVDIDFLATQLSQDMQTLEKVVSKIASLHFDDGVSFAANAITAEEIIEDGDYPGIRIKMPVLIGRAKSTLQLDFGWGDIVIPAEKIIEFPTLLNNEPAPKLKAYSLESAISEKFEVMVSLGAINSRMKDYYDIYVLSLSRNFEAKLLKEAIEATFKNRRTELLNDLLIFQLEFKNNITMQDRWLIFLNKHKLEDVPKEFPEVMSRITSLLNPLVASIIEKTTIDKSWNPNDGTWDN